MPLFVIPLVAIAGLSVGMVVVTWNRMNRLDEPSNLETKLLGRTITRISHGKKRTMTYKKKS